MKIILYLIQYILIGVVIMRQRKDIADRYKWDLTQIYPNVDAWRKDYEELKILLDKVELFKGKLNDKEVLLQYYEFCKKQDILMDKVVTYVYLNHLVNMEDDMYNQMLAMIENMSNDFAIKSAFVLPELNSYDVEYLESLLEDERFKLHYMDIKDLIKHKPHILPLALEELVTKVGTFSGTFSDVFDGFDCVDVKFDKATDSKGKEHEVTNSNFGKLMKNRDRVLRENAYKSMYNAYGDMSTTIANNYIGSVKKDWFFANSYKYKSTLESNLDSNDLTEKVYYTLINNVNKHLDLNHRYIALKKKMLGLDKIYSYDLSLPLSTMDREFEYDDACKIVVDALRILGDDYVQMLEFAINNNWLDVYATKSKDTGGCNISLYGVHSFVLLNHEGTFNDVSTIAHELGHALHYYFTEKTQPFEYSSLTIFLAEIASTTNEVLLKKYMYKTAKDKDEKIFILQEFISLITSTLFGQTMFSEYEDFAHKLVENNQPITKDILLNKYDELQTKYNGDVVEKLDIRKYGCLMVPHFYRAYYVYSYATGITCAINFARNCIDGPEGVEKYRKFLASGTSNYPLEILKECGIDLETDQPYDILFDEMKWALDELESLSN